MQPDCGTVFAPQSGQDGVWAVLPGSCGQPYKPNIPETYAAARRLHAKYTGTPNSTRISPKNAYVRVESCTSRSTAMRPVSTTYRAGRIGYPGAFTGRGMSGRFRRNRKMPIAVIV